MIKLSKKWDYWLKSIAHLALKKWEIIKISHLSQELWISETFLRRIINDFEKSWLLKTIKWRNWWVIVERELKTISLYDIFSSLWEDLSITNCTSWKFCLNEEKCMSSVILNSLQKWFTTLLEMYTLDKVIKKI